MLVYTVVLKRRSWNNIVIGGAAGAFPPLIGAAAVLGQVDALGLYMFAFVFFWTPPHFWTLSLVLRDDYAAAKIPMLGAVASPRDTAVQIMLYILLLTALAWLPLAAGYGGLAFALAATLLGAYWLRASWPLRNGAGSKQALDAYKFSLVYLALVFPGARRRADAALVRLGRDQHRANGEPQSATRSRATRRLRASWSSSQHLAVCSFTPAISTRT